jgi:hypothetical protein
MLERKGKKFVVSSPIQKIESNKEKIKNTVNMFLELF